MTDQLAERRKRIVRALQAGPLTGAQLCVRFGMSRDAMRANLAALVEQGLVRKIGVKGPAVSYEAVKEASSCLPNT